MEATLVDMMYKADNPAAMKYIEISRNNLELVDGTLGLLGLELSDTLLLLDHFKYICPIKVG